MLDNSPGLCYTTIRKRKEPKTMKRKQYYKNSRTGECTEKRVQAIEWYRGKDEVEVWYWSEVCGEWLCGIKWVW